MSNHEFADLRGCSFDRFVAFFFDRDVAVVSLGAEDAWHYHVDVEFDFETVCEYYIQLFEKPQFLISQFTRAQLDEGLWAIQGPNVDCSASIGPDSSQPIAPREACIRSMHDLFASLFQTGIADASAQMWWDSLCYDWHCGNRERSRGGEDSYLQDVFFETLSKVLAIDSEICQRAALHGLGHLRHPKTKELIDRFIDEHPSLTQESVDYARSAARFEVL